MNERGKVSGDKRSRWKPGRPNFLQGANCSERESPLRCGDSLTRPQPGIGGYLRKGTLSIPFCKQAGATRMAAVSSTIDEQRRFADLFTTCDRDLDLLRKLADALGEQ